MPTLEIDGRTITVEDGVNLIHAAERLGIEIPHYCYHPGLSVAGNCRMCLIEIEKAPKLQIACNTIATEGMVVRTQSERVKQARAAVLEFLLINHPIDCPVCDQAGECKLQDYYMDYDRQPSRFALEDKVRKQKALDIGPLVMLDQERCILCTRCTRFLEEVTGTGELGIFERGNHCAIDLFPGRRLENRYSGNVVDICPVGALTSKDFRFRSRVWYLERTPTVCATCATGCNIDIHHRRDEIFRFRPRHNPDVNQYWMCDEGRLSYKQYQGEGRLLQPVMRDGDGWAVRTWEQARGVVAQRIREVTATHGAAAVAAIVGAHATNEEAFLVDQLIRARLGGTVAGLSWSPPDASHDDFLISADKNPNTAGIQAVLRAPQTVETVLAAAQRGEVRVLLIVRANLADACGEAALAALGEAVECVVVLDTHFTPTAEIADVLLPIATFAETDGTFVNRARRVQRVREAVRPPGQARAGWLALSELMHECVGYAVPVDASAVFTELAADQSAFRHLSYARLGEQGAPLESPPA